MPEGETYNPDDYRFVSKSGSYAYPNQGNQFQTYFNNYYMNDPYRAYEQMQPGGEYVGPTSEAEVGASGGFWTDPETGEQHFKMATGAIDYTPLDMLPGAGWAAGVAGKFSKFFKPFNNFFKLGSKGDKFYGKRGIELPKAQRGMSYHNRGKTHGTRSRYGYNPYSIPAGGDWETVQHGTNQPTWGS